MLPALLSPTDPRLALLMGGSSGGSVPSNVLKHDTGGDDYLKHDSGSDDYLVWE
jgi:hypothetical protein